MKIGFIFVLLGVCLSCCNFSNDTGKKETANIDTANTGSAIKPAVNEDTINYSVVDSVMHISLDKKIAAKTISGKLKENNPPIKIYIDINAGDTLHALIEPSDQDANIRLNQIIYPGGRADGPFGRDQKFALAKPGQYQLIIGNNLMAEGKTTTAFTLHLSVY